MTKLYFDYAAATPVSSLVLAAMEPYYTKKFYNPSALYLKSHQVNQDIQVARAKVATILGAKSSEIVFTAGGTESDNLAINGVMSSFPGSNVVVSSVEHDAVLEPAKQHNHKIAPVDESGLINIDKLTSLIDDNTVLISVMYANNEIGTIQPIAKIAKIIHEVRAKRRQSGNKLPIYLHTDACQAANYLNLLVNTLKVDLMTLNGGKIYGPKQSGILYIKTGVKINPQILGGGQERGFRSGTENVSSIVGFAAALEETSKLREVEAKRLTLLRNDFIKSIESNIKGLALNGAKDVRLANNVHISILGVDNERLMMQLDEKDIMVATGSACSASSEEPSHVLKAIGLSDELARCSLRITLGRHTDQESIKTLSQALSTLVAS